VPSDPNIQGIGSGPGNGAAGSTNFPVDPGQGNANNVNAITDVDFGPGKGIKIVIVLLIVLSTGLIALHIGGVRPEAVFDGIKKLAKAVAPATAEKAPVATGSVTTVKEAERKEVEPAVVVSTAKKTQKKSLLKAWEKLVSEGKKNFLDGNYVIADERFDKAVGVARKLDDSDRLVTTLNNLGAVYQVEKKFATAESSYKEAIGLLQSDKSRKDSTMAQVLRNYDNLLKGLGRQSDADWVKHETSWIKGHPILL